MAGINTILYIMRKLFLLVAVLIGITANVSAQTDAIAIIKRYENVLGMDKVPASFFERQMADVELVAQGQQIDMNMIIQEPDKYRIEMDVMGQSILMVVDGDKGWMAMPEMGVMPMPEDAMAQLKNQTGMTRNYKWNTDDFDFELIGDVTEGGKALQAVRFTPKKPTEVTGATDNMMVYFDPATGLMDYITMDVMEGGMGYSAKVLTTDYKEFQGVRIPTVFHVSVDGTEVMTMTLRKVQFDYPVTAETFAEPKM